jgi:DNA polymerase-3 subunit delta
MLNRYLIHGGELFLTQEAVRSIERNCAVNGYTKHEVFEIERSFDWSTLTAAMQERDMFAAYKLVEIRLQVTLAKDQQMAFEKVLDLQTQEIVILVVAKKLTTDSFKQAWIQKIQQTGEIIEAKNITTYQWPQWLNTKLTKLKIKTTPEAFHLLLTNYEGNLIELHQVLDKLIIDYPQQVIDLNICQQYVHHSNILSVFDLSEAIIAGDYQRILRTLTSLTQNNAEPSIVLWAVVKELRLLLNLAHEFKHNAQVGDDFIVKKYHMWQNKIIKYKQILQKTSLIELKKLISLAYKIDLVIKGVESGNVFELISTLCFKLVNSNVTLVLINEVKTV